MRRAAVIATMARRELAAYFHAPIAYVVGVLFLAVQGFSFWAVVRVLADPSQPAPMGAVLHTHFGGTFLYWAVLLLVVAVISMRAIAEDKRSGTWESLLTTPVDEGSVVVGKWLGALAFYALLWVPTLAYPLILTAYAPPGAGFEAGPVAAAYLGVLVTGAAFLAVGVAASAATANQIIAAVVTFVLLLALLLIGQLPELAPDWAGPGQAAHPFISAIDVRGHMDALARGAIDLGALVFAAGATAVALCVATTLAVWERRRRSDVHARLVACALVAVIAGLTGALVERHPIRWDVTRADVNVLDPSTRDLLDQVDGRVQVLVIRPGDEQFQTVYGEVDRLIGRMVAHQPLLARSDLDPLLEEGRVAQLAQEFAIPLGDLRDGGGVVFQRGERRRAVDLLDMVGFDYDDLGAGALSRFHAEEAFAGALYELLEEERTIVCHTSGHGELPLADDDERAHWGAIADRLRRDGLVLEDVGAVSGGVPARCRALLIAGPARPLAAEEAGAVARYLAQGGRLLLAAGDADAAGELPGTGLELVLAEYGVALPRAVVVDPDPQGRLQLPGAWLTADGYGAHPVSSAFQRRRLTVWQRPRAVVAAPGGDATATPLVSSSAAGWGEVSQAEVSAPSRDPEDLPGPVPVAVAAERAGARLVVFGSARSMSSELVGRGLGAQDALAASAVAWLTGRTRSVDIGDKAPETVRLVMSAAQLRQTFALCVVVLPLLLAGLGTVIWWRRRRG